MRNTIFLFIFLLASVNSTHSFEIDGLKDGMSIEEATSVIGSLYDKINIKDNFILALDDPIKGTNRLICLNFCKGELVSVQQNLQPRFDYFVRLVSEKRRELGRPIDAWSQPTDIKSNIESNSISFIWKDGPTFIKVSYTEYSSNNHLAITYEIKNTCWEIPY